MPNCRNKKSRMHNFDTPAKGNVNEIFNESGPDAVNWSKLVQYQVQLRGFHVDDMTLSETFCRHQPVILVAPILVKFQCRYGYNCATLLGNCIKGITPGETLLYYV